MSARCVSIMTQAVLLPALLHLCQLPDGPLLARVLFQLLGTDPHGSVEIKPGMVYPLNSYWLVDTFGESTQLSKTISAFGP